MASGGRLVDERAIDADLSSTLPGAITAALDRRPAEKARKADRGGRGRNQPLRRLASAHAIMAIAAAVSLSSISTLPTASGRSTTRRSSDLPAAPVARRLVLALIFLLFPMLQELARPHHAARLALLPPPACSSSATSLARPRVRRSRHRPRAYGLRRRPRASSCSCSRPRAARPAGSCRSSRSSSSPTPCSATTCRRRGPIAATISSASPATST